HETSIGFVLPESMPASLEVYDLTGRLIKAVDGSYVKGYNTIRIEKKDLNVSGVLYYRLRAGDYVVTKKMIVIE
ncbi:MAG: T9SS type A sorting domain-containing protein, partial [Saprospiraceae bacterium]|nr:T9SS type A sorting domain-containing protein [Saprospiraceae bacterium]